MMIILWIVLAVAVAFGFVFFAARRVRSVLPALNLPPGETLPATPLQRLARWAFVVSLVLVAAAAAIVVYHGPQVYWDNDAVRLTVMGLLLGVLAILTSVVFMTAKWVAAGEHALDERDRAILASASAGQPGAILVTLAAWMVGLTETHMDTHLVPVVFLYLVFWSCLMASVLAWLGGIVLGYRRS